MSLPNRPNRDQVPESESESESEYDTFADIYPIWTASAASATANLPFYVEEYLAADGPVVELGVGDGRIAVEAARRGCTVIGVDRSSAMLAQCRERAERAGVLSHLTLIQADFRDFDLQEPAGLIVLPYHSIGHLVTRAGKSDVMRHIFNYLRPGGRFIFDDFFMTPALIANMREVQLRAAYQSPSGADRLLWVTSLIDELSQLISVVTWEDILNETGVMEQRRYRRLSLSWLELDQARALLEETGFTVEACLGDFQGTPFETTSALEQVWIASTPG
jgi:SAM-dependent methyltransferase